MRCVCVHQCVWPRSNCTRFIDRKDSSSCASADNSTSGRPFQLIIETILSHCHAAFRLTHLDTGLPSLSIDKIRAPQTHLSCPACITLTHARQPNLSSALLVLPVGLARMRYRENRRDREFMVGNPGTKLPARCMLGRRGDFEGLANWLAMLPLWVNPVRLSVCLSIRVYVCVRV